MTEEEINLDFTYAETMALINAYKRHPALWNNHIIEYHTKSFKDDAWVAIAVRTAKPVATCMKKMRSLLSSHRRVKLNIVTSLMTNPITPTWRYWNAFKFLRRVDESEEDPLGTAPKMDILEPQTSQCTNKNASITIKDEIIMTEKEGSEHESIAILVAENLRKMYPDQRLYAEEMIHQVLVKGKLEQLTVKSNVTSLISPEDPLKIVTAHTIKLSNTKTDHRQ